MTARLALQFLGLPQLYLDDQTIFTERRKAIALLAYMAVNDSERGHQNYSRESLSALLWSESAQSRAFSNLRNVIWELHQVLGEGWLVTGRDTLCLNEEAHIDLDVARFRTCLAESQGETEPVNRIPLLLEATRLYRNHFLTGFSAKDAHLFNEWAYLQAEDLRQGLITALETLSGDYCQTDDAQAAIPHARRLVTMNPLDEAAHRRLIQVYLQAGQHGAALRQYQTCEQILRRELDVEPQPETLALYQQIRQGEGTLAASALRVRAEAPLHNLPVQLSTFIGREREIDEVARLLERHRLVTLTGAGGIGKTRLSWQVGTRILNDFPDGVWFIALDALSDPSLVPQTVAAVFDLHEAPGRATLDALARMLRSKTALLILDNCEHVLDACASLALRLLTECPALKILATSREVLHVAGGATYQMPPLSVPYADQASVEQLMQYEAVRLFTERASLARSSFALTDENLQVVIEMCRRLDGIPLAIELAAAQVQVLEPSEVLAQLDTCLELLSTPDTGVSSRHRTLLGSLAWSWGMLVADEQRFMRRLSVFAGGWTLDAAEAVSQENALDLTRALVEKSLLVLDRPLGSRTRYRFHEMVRQYAHDRLLEAGEVEMVRERHLAFFLQLSEQIEAELHGPQETDWLSLADEVRDNLRLALEQASRTDTQAGLYIAGRLQGFWETFSVPEGRRWLEEFLAKPDAREFPHARGKAMYALGMLRIWTQDYAGAASAAQESLAHFRLCGDRSGQVDALLLYGHALQFIDRHVVADEQYTEALELARTDGDARRQAMALFRLGYGRRDLQLEYWETAVDLFLQARDLNSAASLLYATARFRILLTGDLARAKKDLEEAARLGPLRGRNIGGLWEEPAFAKSLVALMQCDFEGAAAPLEAIVTLANELGNRMGYFWARVQLGYVRLRAGDLLEARGIFAETARNFQQDGSTIGVAYSLEGVAALALAVGKPAQAARLLGWADAAREHIGDPRPYLEQANVDRVLAACRASLGEAEFFAAYQEGQGWNLEDAVVAAFAGG